MTETETTKLLKIIEDAYRGRFETDDDMISVWSRLLEDLPYRQAAEAVVSLCRTSTFPPSIAEIRKAVWEIVEPIPSVEDAYMEARRVARNIHPSSARQAEWSHSAVKLAAETIGIETMAYSENPEWIGREFRRIYESVKERTEIRRQGRRMELSEPQVAGMLEGA